MVEKRLFESTDEADLRYVAVNIPCQDACPVYTNVPRYIRAVHEGRYDRAHEINRDVNLFPGVLGRVCSRPCEARCRHGETGLGEPVAICHIKRAAADLGRAASLAAAAPLGRRVTVVGSGPAGLAAARDLALEGFAVEVLEAMELPGGMLRYGIPEFRLPREILEREIQAVLSLGVRLRTGVRVGEDIRFQDVLSASDAVILAAGCYRALELGVPGESLEGVHPGLDFMMAVCAGKVPKVGRRVLVLGGGFTAFDCARSALRLGAEEVTLCLRRTEEDLRVSREEIFETKREGVRIQGLMLARRILGMDRVGAVEFSRVRLGEVDSSGRRRIRAIEGSDAELEADTVIVAVGQGSEPMNLEGPDGIQRTVVGDPRTLRTEVPGLYVTGDYLTGPTSVIEALASGRRAAGRVVQDLTGGSGWPAMYVRMEETSATDRKRSWDYLERREMPTVMPVEDRLESAVLEVEEGFGPGLAQEESRRCYLCFLHYEIDTARCIYCRYCIDVAPRDCIRMVSRVELDEAGAVARLVEARNWREVNAVVIDNARCIRCGECVRVCPMDCISVTRVELLERPLGGNSDGAR